MHRKYVYFCFYYSRSSKIDSVHFLRWRNMAEKQIGKTCVFNEFQGTFFLRERWWNDRCVQSISCSNLCIVCACNGCYYFVFFLRLSIWPVHLSLHSSDTLNRSQTKPNQTDARQGEEFVTSLRRQIHQCLNFVFAKHRLHTRFL